MTSDGTRVPARAVLDAAEERFAAHGHENDGFLSYRWGLLPREPPRQRLPEAFRAWDEVAATLPERYRLLTVREALRDLPVLDADDLPDAFLWRASTLLGILAHAYVRVEPDDRADLPEAIDRPWQQVARRFGRPVGYLSYNDLIAANWRLRDPERTDRMRVDNLDLLVPTVDNAEERIFYLTQVEMLAASGELVRAAVTAQEAVVGDDAPTLEAQLIIMGDCLTDLTARSLATIDPNPHSATHVEPVIWANTVAPFAVPFRDGPPGPSGTGSALFALFDAVLGRSRYRSVLGEETAKLRANYPPLHRQFLEALAAHPIGEYVARRGDRQLAGLYAEVGAAYAGRDGLLSAHRRKVYGYLQMAFKVGRGVTIGGFSQALHDEPWREVDDELIASEAERDAASVTAVHRAALVRRSPAGTGEATAYHVTLDVAGEGLRYRPGDRCAVAVEHDPDLVARVLRVLGAGGREPVELTAAWRAAALLRQGEPAPETLPLDAFLRAVLDGRLEDQWELDAVLELVAADGYDVTRLVRAHLWEDESLARIVPPEPLRPYSIASPPGEDPFATKVELTVGTLAYTSVPGPHGRASAQRGAASSFLGERAPRSDVGNRPLRIAITRSASFRLPPDARTPIVLFAGGTGVAPFQAFVAERAQAADAGDTWLFLAARDREHVYGGRELERLVADGRLHLRLALSGADVAGRSVDAEGGARLVFSPPPLRLPALIAEEAATLVRLLDAGAVLYVCGRAELAQSVMTALHEVLARHLGGDEQARQRIRGLMAERRYRQEVFTTFTPVSGAGVLGHGRYDASEVAVHNDDAHGYWMVVDGAVLDLTEFRQLHPGGRRVVDENAGRDATAEFEVVGHHEHPEVAAMLAMYKIGLVRRLDFGAVWGIAFRDGELVHVSLHDAFRAWVRMLYLVAGLENGLGNDFGHLEGRATRADLPGELSPYGLMLAARSHRRFVDGYVPLVTGPRLEGLWHLTVGLGALDLPLPWLRDELGRVRREPAALRVEELTAAVRRAGHPQQVVAALRSCDQAFLAAVKTAVRSGVRVFEQHEAEAARAGATELAKSLALVPAALRSYHHDLVDAVRVADRDFAASALG